MLTYLSDLPVQRHQFESAFIPTDGFRITLNGVTDGGFFTCHTKSDTAGKFDIPFVLHVECELNQLQIDFSCDQQPIINDK